MKHQQTTAGKAVKSGSLKTGIVALALFFNTSAVAQAPDTLGESFRQAKSEAAYALKMLGAGLGCVAGGVVLGAGVVAGARYLRHRPEEPQA